MVDADHSEELIDMVNGSTTDDQLEGLNVDAVAKLQGELDESRAMIERLQADNRRVTEWFRRWEEAAKSLVSYRDCFPHHDLTPEIESLRQTPEANP
jgi:hypothetical protein